MSFQIYLELKHRMKSKVDRQLGEELAKRRTKEPGKQIAIVRGWRV
jgi:recombination DNA repair RAD52 pathway protein